MTRSMHCLVAGASLLPLSGELAGGRGTTVVDYAPVIDALRAFLEKEMARLGIPCLSIALVDGTSIVWEAGFGIEDPATGVRASPETVYRVGSISKLFVATAIMQLEERKLVDIAAPIVRYAPELVFENPFNPDVPIALRHLLSHRAGILRESPVGNYFDPSEPTIERTVKSIIGSRLVHAVGAAPKYSNLGPTVAGYILERVTGTPFATYVDRNIFGPAGMASSSFLRDKEAIRRHCAKAYMVDFDGTFFPAPTFDLGTIPAGNLFSTAGDLARFMALLFNDGATDRGSVISKASIDRMLTPQFPWKEPADFGLGFFVNKVWDRKIVTHNGAVYGFASAFAAMPAEKIGVVVLNNVDCANGFDEKVARTALRLMLNRKLEAAIPALPEPIDLPVDRLAAYAGKYVAANPRRDAWAYLEGGGLRLRILGVPQVLRAIAEDAFIADGRLGYGATYTFGREPAGRVGTLTSGKVEYRRVPDYRSSSEVPPELARYVGSYGWPHNIMRVYCKDGRLTCLVEWFFEYPLEPRGGNVFAFPDYGLYENETIEFVAGADGRMVEARMGSVPFKRL